MKKSLLILGLLVCTSGVVMAEPVVQENFTPQTQTEVQSAIDKATFNQNQIDSQRKFADKSKYQGKVKYDKNSKEDIKPFYKKDLKTQKPEFKKDFSKNKYRANRPEYRGQSLSGFRDHRPNPYGRMTQKPHRPEYRGYNRHHQMNRFSHNPKMNKNHKVSKTNLKKLNNKKAYNTKSVKTRRR